MTRGGSFTQVNMTHDEHILSLTALDKVKVTKYRQNIDKIYF